MTYWFLSLWSLSLSVGVPPQESLIPKGPSGNNMSCMSPLLNSHCQHADILEFPSLSTLHWHHFLFSFSVSCAASRRGSSRFPLLMNSSSPEPQSSCWWVSYGYLHSTSEFAPKNWYTSVCFGCVVRLSGISCRLKEALVQMFRTPV